MLETLNPLIQDYTQKIQSATTTDSLELLAKELFHPKTGQLSALLRSIGKTGDPAARKTAGQTINMAKQTLTNLIAQQHSTLDTTTTHTAFDTTLPGVLPSSGHLHPLRLVQNELVDIFRSMSFAVHEGNELETEDYCFEFLNIPASHPARDLQDTFYIKPSAEQIATKAQKQVLRTHTSNMQVRLMQQAQPPLRVIVPGRVFRNEAIDASHEHTFYQMEGFVVDEHISIAQLTYMLRLAMSSLLKADVKIRLRPGYFPYVEPGFEADCSCTNCQGKGCSMCKQTGWVEMLGCGMIHPKVFAAAGYPERKYTGFAFGIGLNRLAMLKYSINDIRHFMTNDLRFLKQF